MKPNFKRGMISLVIYGLLLLSAAGFFQYVATQSTPEKLASQGYVYPKTSDTKTSSKTTFAVKAIYRIKDTKYGKAPFVMADDKSLLATEAKPDLGIIKKLEEAQENGTLATNPITIMGEVKELSSVSFQNTRNSLEKQEPGVTDNKEFEIKKLDLTSVANVESTGTTMTALTALTGVAFLAYAVFRYASNKRFYDQLLVTFPELGQDDQALRKGATYYEKHLGVYVYKDQLIVMGRKNAIVDLRDIIYSYVYKETRRFNLYKSVKFVVYLHTKDFKRLAVFPAKHTVKDTEAKLNRLMEYLDASYPQMLVGFDHKDEYMALKQAAGRR
ncbi:hypothetical protein [Abiotrophia defectiva]|uniref:hypothetical protein n=1 Tax=Abiotrophia defectiva TaxID=46125 RepID=UPI0026ED0E1C|nr:hypothetical protein [Abiotrophia defectiva]